MRLWRAFLKNVSPAIGFGSDQLIDLVTSDGHTPQVRRHRAGVIISRVQIVAAAFCLLVPIWGIVDWLVFPWEVAKYLIFARIVSGLIFLGLCWPWENMMRSMPIAYCMLVTLLGVPPLFFLFVTPFIDRVELEGVAAVLAQAYTLLPFIVVAGLSVFPLSLLELLGHAIPIFVITGVSAYQADAFAVGPFISTVWLMFLIIGVSALSGVSQLHYIINLVNKAAQDPLTGAHTRRSGAEAIDLQFRLALLQHGYCAVAFIDIDYFKSVNDQYGHEAGDKVLAGMADALRSHLRTGDVLIRWGGEEFVILLGHAKPEGVRIVVNRILSAGFGPRPDGKPLTVSMGVAERRTDNVEAWEDLVELADVRMYRAKNTGKDRCVLWDGEVIIRTEIGGDRKAMPNDDAANDRSSPEKSA